MINTDNRYTKMQLDFYNYEASIWSEENREPVVGSFDAHNNWNDYENLFTEIEHPKEKIGLDFACGPGRNLVKYSSRFKRLDGVDISPINIKKAEEYTLNYIHQMELI
jgi:ubiquinone/menaquinone biosynthesis C-methylase UbiE